MPMTIAQVLYVLEIADCRSISAAAERQVISQSALSQQIQRLEGELGYPLFVRTPRGLTGGPAGRRAVAAALQRRQAGRTARAQAAHRYGRACVLQPAVSGYCALF